MTIKAKIILILKDNPDLFISGTKLAKDFNVSRTAIWKAINSLKKEGYNISSDAKKGYMLSNTRDILSKNDIYKKIGSLYDKYSIRIVDSIDSTNTELKKLAQGREREFSVLIANTQKKGRGRREKEFHSKKGGLYFSILLRPRLKPKDSLMITTLSAVAICEAIERVFYKYCKIKWVNDILLDGKKVAGILTEASINMENMETEYVVLGIGVNISTDKNSFPSEIKNKAGTILDSEKAGARNSLMAEFLIIFDSYYQNIKLREHMPIYEKKSILLNKKISYIINGVKKSGKCIGISNDAKLIIKDNNSSTILLESGEVDLDEIYERNLND